MIAVVGGIIILGGGFLLLAVLLCEHRLSRIQRLLERTAERAVASDGSVNISYEPASAPDPEIFV